MARWLYGALWHVLTPLLPLNLWWRGRRQPAYRQHRGERYGYYPTRLPRPVIWLHAVSVGETRAAAPLVRALQARYPDHHLLITQTTPTGRDTARSLFGDGVQLAYLPFDMPAAVRRFVRHFQPEVGILLETEIWPNLLHEAARAGTAMYLVNARLSERSRRGYARIAGLIGPSLQQLRGIAAQSPDDASRLASLASGSLPIRVCGNLKYELHLDPLLLQRGRQWRECMGSRPVWLFANTRDGEEALLLDALAAAPLPAEALLILVPRHPQRFDEIAAMIRSRGHELQRRSDWQGTALPATVRVLLGDSMGELAAYYAAADVALMGGTLLDYGSHNVIEAAAAGTPLVIGPSTFNFADAARQTLSSGAAVQAADVHAALRAVAELLADPERRQAMAQAGQSMVAQNAGATAGILAMLEEDGHRRTVTAG